MKIQRSNRLILILLIFCGCGNSTVPTFQNSVSIAETNQNASHRETIQAYLERFGTWYSEANKRITQGYEKASAEVELEDGGEWGCDWEMDALAINADARKAIQNTDLLHPLLQKKWLAILDSADQHQSVYSIGTLMHMGKYQPDCFGEKTSAFYLQSSNPELAPPNGDLDAIWFPETICSGMAVTGMIAVKLRDANGKLQLVAAEYVPD